MTGSVPVVALAAIAGLAYTDTASSEQLAMLASVAALVSGTLCVLVARPSGEAKEAKQDADEPASRQPRHLIRGENPGVEMLEEAGNDQVASLADALPEGCAFDRGLARLQGDEAALERPRFVEPPIASLPPSPPGLARRVPNTAMAHERSEPPMVASSRSPEEVRAMLARYHQGLEGARAGQAPPPDPDVDPADVAAGPAGGGRQ